MKYASINWARILVLNQWIIVFAPSCSLLTTPHHKVGLWKPYHTEPCILFSGERDLLRNKASQNFKAAIHGICDDLRMDCGVEWHLECTLYRTRWFKTCLVESIVIHHVYENKPLVRPVVCMHSEERLVASINWPCNIGIDVLPGTTSPYSQNKAPSLN